MALRGYCRLAAAALREEDGSGVANLLELYRKVPAAAAAAVGRLPRGDRDEELAGGEVALATYLASSSGDALELDAVVAAASSALAADGLGGGGGRAWAGVLAPHIVAAAAAARARYAEAYAAQHDALAAFLPLFEAAATNWLVRVLHVLVHDAVALLRVVEHDLAAAGAGEGVGEMLVRSGGAHTHTYPTHTHVHTHHHHGGGAECTGDNAAVGVQPHQQPPRAQGSNWAVQEVRRAVHCQHAVRHLLPHRQAQPVQVVHQRRRLAGVHPVS